MKQRFYVIVTLATVFILGFVCARWVFPETTSMPLLADTNAQDAPPQLRPSVSENARINSGNDTSEKISELQSKVDKLKVLLEDSKHAISELEEQLALEQQFRKLQPHLEENAIRNYIRRNKLGITHDQTQQLASFDYNGPEEGFAEAFEGFTGILASSVVMSWFVVVVCSGVSR